MSSDPDSSIFLLLIIISVVFIIINGITSAADAAINSLNKTRVKTLAEEKNKRGLALMKILEDPSDFFITVRTFNLLTSVITVIVSCNLFLLPLSRKLYGSILLSGIVIILAITFIMMVFCQVYPRRVGVQHSEGASFRLVNFIRVLIVILKPLTFIIAIISKLLLKLTGQKSDITEEFSEDEIREMLEVGQETGQIKEEGKKMIDSIFAFDDKLAYEIMTPRTDVFLIDINDPAEEYIDELMELRYSRIPVCEDDSDNIIGILHIKDYLIKARLDGFDNVDIKEILRKAYFVPETKNIDSLFFELQKTKQHIAILIDEYGGFSGIVTMEDIIEEVMGDIDDEYDEEELEIVKIDEITYIIDGNTDLDDIDEELDLHLESDKSETLGGYLIDILGEIPDETDERSIEAGNLVFTIMSVKDRRIEKVQLTILPEKEEEEEEN